MKNMVHMISPINPHRIKKQRKEQFYVTNDMRLGLVILITEFGLSCYLAAKVLNVPYTNAKVIYRVFREENRVISHSLKSKSRYGLPETFLMQHSHLIRKNVKMKLKAALNDGIMTET